MTPKPDRCPKCGSKNVASILYGLPMFGEELERQLEGGEDTLDGCIVTGDNPIWHCSACRHQWGGEDSGIEGDDGRPG